MALHFSSEKPEDQFYTDFGNLNKFPQEAFVQIGTAIFNFLLDPQQSAAFLGDLESFASQYGFGLNGLKNLMKSVILFFKASIKRTLSPSLVREDLIHLGLSEEKAEWVCEQWKSNMVAMSRIAAGQSLTVNQLVDMEWRFGVTSSNNDMMKIGNTFLQLKLVLDKGVGNEEVFMELTLPQFYQFLHEMERAKDSLENLS